MTAADAVDIAGGLAFVLLIAGVVAAFGLAGWDRWQRRSGGRKREVVGVREPRHRSKAVSGLPHGPRVGASARRNDSERK